MNQLSIPQNLKLDKKFRRRKHDIFQSINMKKQLSKSPLVKPSNKQQQNSSIFSFLNRNLPPNLQKSAQKSINELNANSQSLLPKIYLYSRPKPKQIIPISNNQTLIKQISQSLTFVNKKTAVMNMSILSQLKQQTKAIPYNSPEYETQLKNLNRIFGGCGINLKVKDVLVVQGIHSKTKFSLFTNYPKHPYSLCCKSEIIMKHIDFISAKYFNFPVSRSQEKISQSKQKEALKSIILVSCLECGEDIFKIKPESVKSGLQSGNLQNSRVDEQKRLLNYSKLISSGRFKKNLINDQSVTLMYGRNLTLDRSKSGLSRIQQQHLVKSKTNIARPSKRYSKQSQRQSRVRSQQATISMTLDKISRNDISINQINVQKRSKSKNSKVRLQNITAFLSNGLSTQ